MRRRRFAGLVRGGAGEAENLTPNTPRVFPPSPYRERAKIKQLER